MTSRRSHQANTRTGQRKLAFQVLYCINFTQDADNKLLRATLDNFTPEEARNNDFASDLVFGVIKNVSKLDKIIADYSSHWKIERIAKIELTILRLSLYEMIMAPEIPLRVAINEAVELAKMFGDDNSKTFVNGILDTVGKDVEKKKFEVNKAV